MKNLYKTNKKANNSYKNKFLGQSITMVQSAQEQNTYNRSAILNQTDDVITDDMTQWLPFHLKVSSMEINSLGRYLKRINMANFSNKGDYKCVCVWGYKDSNGQKVKIHKCSITAI